MKLTPRRTVAAVILLFIGAAAAWMTIGFNNSRAAVRRCRQELQSHGEKLLIDELLPPSAPSEQNSVCLLRQAFSAMSTTGTLLETNPPPAMRMVAPGKAMVGSQRSDIRDQGTNTWDEVAAELDDNKDGLDLLAQTIDKPAFDFGLNYHQGFSLLLPHLAPMKRAALLLKSAAVYDLHQGKPGLAIDRIRVILALVKADEEPLLISQLVRIADANIALDATWEVLHAPGVQDEQLARLQRDWERIDFLPGSERAVAMERAMVEQEAERMRNSSASYRSMTGLTLPPKARSSASWFELAGQSVIATAHESAWRYGWSYPDELRMLKGHQAVLECLRSVGAEKPYKEAMDAMQAAVSRAGIQQKTNDDSTFFIGSFDPRTLLSQSVWSEQRYPQRLLMMQTARRLVITAIALERFKLAHNEYPETLPALVAQFLNAAPLDPVDHQPLRYHRPSPQDFVLYSVGADGVDDGGDPNPPAGSDARNNGREEIQTSWLKSKDQVWPQPASQEEIEQFLKKRAHK